MIDTCDKWLKEIYAGKIIIAVFLDCKRAFEIVIIELLIRKLEFVGTIRHLESGFRVI